MKSDAWGLVFTGLSLTSLTAAALFVLVAVHPKQEFGGTLPLLYAGGSAMLAVTFNRAAAWASRR